MPRAEKYTSDIVGIGINVRVMEVFQQMSYFRHYNVSCSHLQFLGSLPLSVSLYQIPEYA